ncbi:PREDICTED: calcium-binding tyrosine phosphorylation-regulated protein [Merops nubicus]|uniref:calcium-binding tyrosine phosphorylation-regulated protein n=1 Tax=Merops nubicus TaxID=57421 RepID=UPI0004F08A4C|nr:PREDICTED: calcium-binding tyrosine phosphorylation-regulated protein [Merops nubicus]
MQSSKMKLVVPYGLRILLEGVSQAVVESNPKDITQFFALYFQELVTFQKGSGNHSLEKTASEFTDTPSSGEPEQQDKSTDTEEDHILEEPDIQHSSKATQQPSTTSCIAESRCPPGSGGALSPEEPQLAYVPAQPAQLAAHLLAMASGEAGQPPPPSNLWTLYCLTDLRQGHSSPPPAARAGGCAPLAHPGEEEEQSLQLSQASAPIYVMQDKSRRGKAPPLILVGSSVQPPQGWEPLPGHAVFAGQGAGARRRFMTLPVPVARPAAEETEEGGAQPSPPPVLSVAIPLDDVGVCQERFSSTHR